MSQFNDYPLTLSSDAFNALKNDFNQMLRQTLSSMELKDADEATINIKLNISLSKDHVPDLGIVTHDAEREIVRPKFDHKVTATIQYKSEKSGTLAGDYELVWDKTTTEWVMRPITNGQTNMFDREDRDQPTEYDDSPSPMALGSHVAGALPPARSNIIDADFSPVEGYAAAADSGYGYEEPEGL